MTPNEALGVEPIKVLCAVSLTSYGTWLATSAHEGQSYTGRGPSRPAALNWLKINIERALGRFVELEIV